jgi:hypothetical protein
LETKAAAEKASKARQEKTERGNIQSASIFIPPTPLSKPRDADIDSDSNSPVPTAWNKAKEGEGVDLMLANLRKGFAFHRHSGRVKPT